MRIRVASMAVLGLLVWISGILPVVAQEGTRPARRGEPRRERDRPRMMPVRPGPLLLRALDSDGDGTISKEEWEGFFRMADEDGDGRLDPGEFASFLRSRSRRPGGKERPGPLRRDEVGGADRPGAPDGQRGDVPGVEEGPAESKVDPEVARLAGELRKARSRDDLPCPGQAAPDFRLRLLEGSNPPDFVLPDDEGRVRLSAHRGRKPVVLIFGSYT